MKKTYTRPIGYIHNMKMLFNSISCKSPVRKCYIYNTVRNISYIHDLDIKVNAPNQKMLYP
jgi:hypothetical protein